MGWRIRLRQLPLRTKVVVTLVGAGFTLLGVTTYLSFGYWQREVIATSEQQALLAASSVRAGLESAMTSGRREQARRNLTKLAATAPITAARVYGTRGTIVLSANPNEEGTRRPGVWIPAAGELPSDGLARPSADQTAVRAFLPVSIPQPAVLEVEFSVEPLKRAMERGARLGMLLVVGSLFALAAILFSMIEREVVGPIQRMAGLLGQLGDAGGGELRRIESSVAELIERGQTAEGLAEAQRRQLAAQAGLAEVGELAAEMAHEFKRPLASIRSALGLLEQEYVLEENAQRLLGAVNEQMERLTETMQDLFGLARPVGLETEPVDLRDVLDSALAQLAAHPAAQSVHVEREYDAAAEPVQGDAHRLEQAMLNLMLNAVEAMSAGGTLGVRTRMIDGPRVEVEISDTGSGIPASEVEKVLRPFYSTKPLGTGLGLPLVARVVAAHDGQLKIRSQPGAGTTVLVRFPVPRPRGSEGEEASWQTRGSSSSMTTS